MFSVSSAARRASTTFASAAVVLLGLTLAISNASAKDYRIGDLKIESPWARATPKGARVGGGYLSISNTGNQPDKLTGGSLNGAGKVEIHEMKMEDGIMKMHPVPGDGLEIAPGKTVVLKPGGYHMMFMDLKAPLKQGDTVPGSLIFEKAGAVPVEFSVQGLAAQSPAAGEHQMHMEGM